MSESRAGWYPDPSGDQSRLRYWDGSQWTNDYADSPASSQAAAGQDASPSEEIAYQAQIVDNCQVTYDMSSQDSHCGSSLSSSASSQL